MSAVLSALGSDIGLGLWSRLVRCGRSLPISGLTVDTLLWRLLSLATGALAWPPRLLWLTWRTRLCLLILLLLWSGLCLRFVRCRVLRSIGLAILVVGLSVLLRRSRWGALPHAELHAYSLQTTL